MRTYLNQFISVSTLCLLMCLYGLNVQGQRVDTLVVESKCLKRDVKNIVIYPKQYDQNSDTYPVLYLLHGYGGNQLSWISKIRSDLPELASTYGMVIICPDGGKGWYLNSPAIKDSQYETYMIEELLPYVESKTRTTSTRNQRGITGFSMGGHGALYLALRHPDLFAVAGSMSGGVDFRPFPNSWFLKELLGGYDPNVWSQYVVTNLIPYNQTDYTVNLFIDCGVDDFFYDVNQALHDKLSYYRIPHTFISRPGQHNNQYWNDAILYQLQYFHSKFKMTR